MNTIEQVKAENRHNTLLKVGILGISLFLQVAGSNVAAIPLISKSYPGVSTTNIQALFTIPSFTIMLGILCSNAFIKWLGKRATVLIGMVATLIGALIPVFVNDYGIIVASRLLLGAGIGLFTSLSVSLIGDCFSDEEQKTLIGIQGAMGTLGNSSLTFVSGLLLGINWQASFLYMLAIIPFIFLFMFGYTNKMEKATTVKAEASEKKDTGSKAKIPVKIYVTFGLLFLFFSAFLVMSTAGALTIAENKLANQNWLSTEFAVAGLLGAGVSMFYSKIFKVLGHFTPVVAIGLSVLGFIILATAGNMVIFFAGLILVNCGTLIIPYVYDTILGEVDPAISNLVISIAQIFNNFGAFSSPYVINFFRSIIGVQSQASSMIISAVIMAVITAIFLVIAISRSAKKGKTANA